MKLLGWTLTKSETSGGQSIDQIMARLEAAYETVSGIVVTPESCMRAPTVQALVQAVSKRIATLSVSLYRKTTDASGRPMKEPLPSHPIAKLLNNPNTFQNRVTYWLDATSVLMRYGRFFAYKAQGNTGPILRLIPLHPSNVHVGQDKDWSVRYRVNMPDGGQRDVPAYEMHYVRGAARDFVVGDSPVSDVHEAIAMEIAAEQMGASFFGNGAMPSLIFKFMQGVRGFKTDEERAKFLSDFQNAYGSRRRFKGMLLPVGMDVSDPIATENNKAQFLETRKYQRTVIAAAWGVPPHLVGDLERGTFNNVEQQSIEFIQAVVVPYVTMFEAAMERDLLTQSDRNSGVIVRFNIDAALRGDFKSRQEGMQIQRQNGIISANEWRERENMNPLEEADGGDEYIVPANFRTAGEPPDPVGDTPDGSSDPSALTQESDTVASKLQSSLRHTSRLSREIER